MLCVNYADTKLGIIKNLFDGLTSIDFDMFYLQNDI